MQIVWTEPAILDLSSLRTYIGERNPAAASSIVLLVLDRVQILQRYPNIGRVGRVPGTRELIVNSTDYLVPYRSGQDRVEILRVLHARQTWPEMFL